LYNVKNANGVSANPLFVGSGDYHLKANSPCRFPGYQLGCFSESTETDNDVSLMISVSKDYTDKLINSLSKDYTIYRSN
jgi:hypothetical protein